MRVLLLLYSLLHYCYCTALHCARTAGEYGVEFYANEPSRDGDTFTHMAQYLLAWQLPTGTTTPEGFRDMYNFENYAPSLGQVPLPYATDQYQPGSAPVPGLEQVKASGPYGQGRGPGGQHPTKPPPQFHYDPVAPWVPPVRSSLHMMTGDECSNMALV